MNKAKYRIIRTPSGWVRFTIQQKWCGIWWSIKYCYREDDAVDFIKQRPRYFDKNGK